MATEKIELTQVYGPVRSEGAPPINPQVASDFLGILVAVRKPVPEWMKSRDFPSTPELEERITSVLDAAEIQVPGINRDSLDRIIRHDPWNYERWGIMSIRRGSRSEWSFVFDFPMLAANWDKSTYREAREIAERDYGIREKELDFLRAVFEQVQSVAEARLTH